MPLFHAGILRCILAVTGLSALILSISAIKIAHPAFTRANFPPERVVLLVELLGRAEDDPSILVEWDDFAAAFEGKEHVDVRILCTTPAEETLASSMVHLRPFLILHDETWADVFRSIQEDRPAPTLVGLFAAGSLPVEGLRHSMISMIEALSRSPEDPTAIISRSSVRRPVNGVVGDGTWLSDMLVAQLWCNPPALSPQHLSEAGLEEVTVRQVSMLGAISIFLRSGTDERVPGTTLHIVDGTDLLRSTVHGKAPTVWCQHETSGGETQHHTCERPRAILGSSVDSRRESRENVNIIRNIDFSIGDLGVAVVATVQEDLSPITYSFDHASWPPNYLLETVASREGLVVVTSVNCGYLDMATNFLMTVQAHSDAKVGEL